MDNSPGGLLNYAGTLWERGYASTTNSGAKSLYPRHPTHQHVFPAVGSRGGGPPRSPTGHVSLRSFLQRSWYLSVGSSPRPAVCNPREAWQSLGHTPWLNRDLYHGEGAGKNMFKRTLFLLERDETKFNWLNETVFWFLDLFKEGNGRCLWWMWPVGYETINQHYIGCDWLAMSARCVRGSGLWLASNVCPTWWPWIPALDNTK